MREPTARSFVRQLPAWLLMLCLAAWLAACGGGDERGEPVPVVATVGPAGGTIEVLDFAGGTLTVEIPAGALTQPAEIRVEPLSAASGTGTRFRITPAGLAFAARVTLRYTGDSTPAPRSVLRWWVDGEAFPMPTTQQGAELRASIMRLGHVFTQSAAGASRERAASLATAAVRPLDAGDARVELDVASLDCDLELGLLRLQIAAAASENDIERVQAQYDRMVAVVEACSLREQQDLTARACAAFEGAVLTAQVVAANSYQTFRDVVTPLMLTQAGVQVTGATCQGAATLDTLMQAKLDQFIDFIAADYARPDFAADFDTAAREVQRLFRYDTECQYMGLFPACGRFGSELIPTVLDRLREAAFRDCRDTGSRLLLSKMYAQQVEVVRDIVQPQRADRERPAAASGAYLVYGNYDFADLEKDMAYCRSTLQVRVYDDARPLPIELEDRRVELPASTTVGTHQTTLEIEVPRDGSVNVSGSVATLTCPDGTPSADEIVARVNGVRLAARPANGDTFAIDSQAFDLVVEDVLAEAVPNGAQASEFEVELLREGSACSGLFTDSVLLYTLRVRIATLPDDDVLITTAWLPSGVVNQPYGATLSAPGDPDVYTWSATGLPPGLSMSTSGIVSGVPTTKGTFASEVTATDTASGATGSRQLTITITEGLQITTNAIGIDLPDTRFVATLPYYVVLSANGAQGPLTWSLIEGVLPSGLTLSADGTLSGNVSQAGSPTIRVQVSDGVETVDGVIEFFYSCCFN